MSAKTPDEHFDDIKDMARLLAASRRPHGNYRAIAHDYRNATPEQLAEIRTAEGRVIDVDAYYPQPGNTNNNWNLFVRLVDVFGENIPAQGLLVCPDVPSFGSPLGSGRFSYNLAHQAYGTTGMGPSSALSTPIVAASMAPLVAPKPQLFPAWIDFAGALSNAAAGTNPARNEMLLMMTFRPLGWGADMGTPEAAAISDGLTQGKAQKVKIFIWEPAKPKITLNTTFHPQSVTPAPIPYFD